MWQRFSESARVVVYQGQEAAQAAGLDRVEPVALMIGVLASGDEEVGRILAHANLKAELLSNQLKESLPKGTQSKGAVRLSKTSKQALSQAYAEARRLGHDYIGPQHLFVGLLSVGDKQLSEIFVNLGTDYVKVRPELEEVDKDAFEPIEQNQESLYLWQKLSPSARVSIRKGQEVTQELGLDTVSPAALMLGVLASGGEGIGRMLATMEADPEPLLDILKKSLPNGTGEVWHFVGVSLASSQAVDAADREARRWRQQNIGPEHLFIGLLSVGDQQLSDAFASVGIDYEKAHSVFEKITTESVGRHPRPLTGSINLWERLQSWLVG